MPKKIRRALATGAVAASVALSVVPATPAAAQTHDCKIMGGGNYIAEVVDCVYLILSSISDPLPPR